MLATNMAPVSLSSSLFSVTMYNLGSSPRLLTMSFHIMLFHTRSCSQQAVTQLLCLKVRPVFAVNVLGACIEVTGNTLSAFPSGNHWQWNWNITHRSPYLHQDASLVSDKWHFVKDNSLTCSPAGLFTCKNPGFCFFQISIMCTSSQYTHIISCPLQKCTHPPIFPEHVNIFSSPWICCSWCVCVRSAHHKTSLQRSLKIIRHFTLHY